MADHSAIGKSNVRRSKTHERRIAKLLTEWSGVQFRRRRVEGRDSAVRVVELVADVIPCEGDFHFSIEAKCGKKFSLDALMANPTKCLFTDWWHQACYDAQLISGDLNRIIYPLMFFKPHPNWDWVAFSSYSLRVIKQVGRLDAELTFPHLSFDAFSFIGPIEGDVSHSKKNEKLVKIDLDPVIICRWYDFANNIDPVSTFVSYPNKL